MFSIRSFRGGLTALPLFVPFVLPLTAAVTVTAPSAVLAAGFERVTPDAPMRYTIDVNSTSLIRLDGDRIISAVYDQALFDVKTDSEAGHVYVMPKTEGRSMFYITAASGDTAVLELNAQESGKAQVIVLRPKMTAPAAATPLSDADKLRQAARGLRPLAGDGWSANLKRLMTAVIRGRSDDAIVQTDIKTPGPATLRAIATLAPLKVTVKAVWRSSEAEATAVTLKNTQILPVKIDPVGLSAGALYATAFTSLSLAPGEEAVAVFAEAPRDGS